MQLTQLVLKPEMGAILLDFLRKMSPLPAVGYVAGQSVASAIFDVFGAGDGQVYNDIDVFYDPATFCKKTEAISAIKLNTQSQCLDLAKNRNLVTTIHQDSHVQVCRD